MEQYRRQEERPLSVFESAAQQKCLALSGRIGSGKRSFVRQRTADLQQAATNNELRSLAQDLRLLTTMAIIHQQETSLPNQREVLYERAVDILLRRWQEGEGFDLSAEMTVFMVVCLVVVIGLFVVARGRRLFLRQ